MARQFTRSEFYELVWSKPMTHLAKEFGLSDVALHKICRKHDVPNPPLGWWARHAAGQKVKRTPLPRLKSGISDTINIGGGELRNEPDSVAQMREEARVRASAFDPKKVDQEHSIITRSMAKLRKAKPDERGLVRLAQSGLIDAELNTCLDQTMIRAFTLRAMAGNQHQATCDAADSQPPRSQDVRLHPLKSVGLSVGLVNCEIFISI